MMGCASFMKPNEIGFILIILYLLCTCAQSQEDNLPSIVTDPSPTNVSINSLASFTCSAKNVFSILWRVNYSVAIDEIERLNDKQTVRQNGSIFTYEMKIEVNQSLDIDLLNNSMVVCRGYIFLGSGFVEYSNYSSPALLLIQGKLDPPKNVEAEIDADVLYVIWTAPFFLKGIFVNYLVTVTTATTISDSSPFQNHTTLNESASFPTFDDSYCTSYTTCVRAVTAAGIGGQGCSSQISRKGVPWSLTDQQVCVRESVESTGIVLSYMIEQNKCIGEQASSFSIDVYHDGGSIQVPNITTFNIANGTILYNICLPLSAAGSFVTSVIILTNSAGSTMSNQIYTRLTNIEDVNISISDDGSSFSVICSFLSNSDNTGCQIVVQCTLDEPSNIHILHIFNLHKESKSTSSINGVYMCDQICSAYSLSAYDIFSNGEVADTPAVTTFNISCKISQVTQHLTPSATSFQPSITTDTSCTVISWVAMVILAVIEPALILLLIIYLRLACRKVNCCFGNKENSAKERSQFDSGTQIQKKIMLLSTTE